MVKRMTINLEGCPTMKTTADFPIDSKPHARNPKDPMNTPSPLPGGKSHPLKTAAVAVAVYAAVLAAAHAGPIINVLNHGAIPGDANDDAPAFQSALNALKSAGGGCLFIPAGAYRFHSRVSVSTGAWEITLVGEGNATILQCYNSSGIFQLTHSSRSPQVSIFDMLLTAEQGNAGTAIEVTCPTGGVADKRIVTMARVHAKASGSNYFNAGFRVLGLYRPLISDCSVRREVNSDFGDGSINFQPWVGIDISDCYAPVVERCTVSGAYMAYRFDTGSNMEDGAVRNSSADYCRVGIYFAQAASEPTLWIHHCDIRARDIGVQVVNRRICYITDNTFRKLAATDYTLTDIQLNNVHLGHVARNTFQNVLNYGRKNVKVDGNGNWIIIKDNALAGASADAIQIDAGAQNILKQ
jgi:hypothetical protein